MPATKATLIVVHVGWPGTVLVIAIQTCLVLVENPIEIFPTGHWILKSCAIPDMKRIHGCHSPTMLSPTLPYPTSLSGIGPGLQRSNIGASAQNPMGQ